MHAYTYITCCNFNSFWWLCSAEFAETGLRREHVPMGTGVSGTIRTSQKIIFLRYSYSLLSSIVHALFGASTVHKFPHRLYVEKFATGTWWDPNVSNEICLASGSWLPQKHTFRGRLWWIYRRTIRLCSRGLCHIVQRIGRDMLTMRMKILLMHVSAMHTAQCISSTTITCGHCHNCATISLPIPVKFNHLIRETASNNVFQWKNIHESQCRCRVFVMVHFVSVLKHPTSFCNTVKCPKCS